MNAHTPDPRPGFRTLKSLGSQSGSSRPTDPKLTAPEVADLQPFNSKPHNSLSPGSRAFNLSPANPSPANPSPANPKPLPSGVAPGSLALRPLGSSLLNPVPVAPGGASRADELVSEIGQLLQNPGRSAYAVRTLTRVDGLFSELDRQLRSGGPLPSTWRAALRPAPPSSRRGIAYEYATQCYDAVSETLREVGGVVVAWRALREAAREWERLNRALIERAPLPEPWLPPDDQQE